MKTNAVLMQAGRLAREAGLRTKDGVLQGPGKFESGTLDVFYFWTRGMEGDGEIVWSDENGGGCSESFDVSPEERAAFGFEPYVSAYLVEEDGNGFVYGTPMSAKSLARLVERIQDEEDEKEGTR